MRPSKMRPEDARAFLDNPCWKVIREETEDHFAQAWLRCEDIAEREKIFNRVRALDMVLMALTASANKLREKARK